MCAQLYSCPLCTQPSFQSLDSLRVGLVSVATRPLMCPVCNETLLGIDKLTIHLFGHTINNTTQQTTRLSSENQLESNKVTIPHTWNVKNYNIDTSSKAISNVYPSNLHVESVDEKSENQMVFINEFSHHSNIIELSKTLPLTQELIQTTSTIPEAFDNTTNKIMGDVKLVTVLNFNSLQSESSSGKINKLQCQEEISKYNSRPSSPSSSTSSSSSSSSSSSLSESSSVIWRNNLALNSNLNNSTINTTTNSLTSNNFMPIMQSKTEIVASEVDKSVQNKPSASHTPEQFHDSTTFITNNEIQCQTTALNNNQILPQLKGLRMLTLKEKTERCNICGFHFPDHNILTLHKQLIHMINEEDLNAKPQTILKNYPCHLCSKVFKMRGSLIVHMRVAHSGYNLASLSNNKNIDSVCCENGFNCPICGKNFRKEQHVTQHLKTHEGKQWGCDVCSKMFTTKYFLKKHKRLHSGEMPYKCNICDKTFTFQQSYHKHRLYHKDDKPHTCNTCGRSFKELSTLHNHERIHTGEKPFACETCGKCFRQRVSYVVHRRIHTGVMPYCCTLCGKNFRYKVSQRTHKCPAQLEDSGGISSDPHPPPPSSHTNDNCNTPVNTASNPSISMLNNDLSPFELHETNKYVLIVNNDGQSFLRRESELNSENNKTNNTNDSSKTLSPNECNDILNESLKTNTSEDFFSLVMPSLNNDLSLPSTKMKELRLSSPINELNFDDELRENTNLQKDIKHAIDGILHERHEHNNETDPLQTINEESLRQLLYGTDKKM